MEVPNLKGGGGGVQIEDVGNIILPLGNGYIGEMIVLTCHTCSLITPSPHLWWWGGHQDGGGGVGISIPHVIYPYLNQNI